MGVEDSAPQCGRLSAPARAALMVGTGLLHLAVYFAVNELNAGRPASEFWSARTPVDRWIPYVGWTSIVYYLGDLYIVGWGAFVVWRLRGRDFLAGLGAFAAIILAGASIQALFPVEAPFPRELSPVQAFIHGRLSVRPFATFPSMHVALATLPAALAPAVASRRAARWSAAAAVAIAVSTVTAKEHFVLDAVAGAALGLGGFALWRKTRSMGERTST